LTAARSSGRLNVNGQLVPRVPLVVRRLDALERHPRVVDDEGDDAARLARTGGDHHRFGCAGRVQVPFIRPDVGDSGYRLRLAVLQHLEIGGPKRRNVSALPVGYHRVHLDERHAEAKDGSGRFRLLRPLPGALFRTLC
jgi:hypothetical protein